MYEYFICLKFEDRKWPARISNPCPSPLLRDQAHALIDPWLTEESLKKSKAQLIRLLADFDRQFGHGGEVTACADFAFYVRFS